MFTPKQITPSQLQQLQEVGALRLLDVRSAEEVAQGVLHGAEHLLMQQVPASLDAFCPETPTVVYCRSGVRSRQVAAFLSQVGFNNVMNLEGGLSAWLRAGGGLAPLGAADGAAA